MNAARLFGWYNNHYEPLTFMGDSSYWRVLNDLATATHPAIELDKQGDKPNQWQITPTALAEQLLAGQVDWLKLNAVSRWWGGVLIESEKGQVWRYDMENSNLINML
jgi:hypothetical protein